MKTNIKIKKIKIREEIDHLINIDASIGGYQFDLILVCSSETFCGRNWHLVIPNWEVNCRIGKDLIYNKIKIEKALQPVMQYTDEYVENIAKIVTEHLERHDKVIDKAIIENLIKADKTTHQITLKRRIFEYCTLNIKKH